MEMDCEDSSVNIPYNDESMKILSLSSSSTPTEHQKIVSMGEHEEEEKVAILDFGAQYGKVCKFQHFLFEKFLGNRPPNP